MSDASRTGVGCASSGFNSTKQQDLRQQGTDSPRTDSRLTSQVQQEGWEGSPSRIWNIHTFLRDAHKPTGEASAFRALLVGSLDGRTTITMNNDTSTTTIPGVLTHKQTVSGFVHCSKPLFIVQSLSQDACARVEVAA